MEPFARIEKDDPVNSSKIRIGLNRVFDILTRLRTGTGLSLERRGNSWTINTSIEQAPSSGSGGIPAGYEEETLNIITDAGIVTRKVLVETATKASVETFASEDSRLLLAITTDGVVRKSKGYLKNGLDDDNG